MKSESEFLPWVEKYRPSNMNEIISHTQNIETIKKLLFGNSLPHLLFYGSSGTGKTSTARIFAKAVNCLHPENGNPCGKCDICKSFDEEKLVDIIEIDAASYT